MSLTRTRARATFLLFVLGTAGVALAGCVWGSFTYDEPADIDEDRLRLDGYYARSWRPQAFSQFPPGRLTDSTTNRDISVLLLYEDGTSDGHRIIFPASHMDARGRVQPELALHNDGHEYLEASLRRSTETNDADALGSYSAPGGFRVEGDSIFFQVRDFFQGITKIRRYRGVLTSDTSFVLTKHIIPDGFFVFTTGREVRDIHELYRFRPLDEKPPR